MFTREKSIKIICPQIDIDGLFVIPAEALNQARFRAEAGIQISLS
jgi:hypothetical protein